MRMDFKDHREDDDKEVKIYTGPVKEPPITKNKNFLASFEFALQGFKTAFKEERNLRKDAVAAVCALTLGAVLKLSASEWLWLLLVIFLVIVMEIVNTAFENVVDMVTDHHFHPIGKKIKDMAAAAVLFTALFAVIVGIFLFAPKLLALLSKL